MPDQDDDLPFGLYERLITASLQARLLRFDPAAARVVRENVDPAEAHATLARHVEGLLASALKDLPQEGRAAKQAELANEIIRLLTGTAKAVPYENHDDVVEIPPEQLRSIQPVTGALADDREVVAPLVPLSASDPRQGLDVSPRHGLLHCLHRLVQSLEVRTDRRRRMSASAALGRYGETSP